MAGGGGEGLSQLWTDWGIQILVLLSFGLQVLLLLIGGMRRRGLSAWQRVVLWFAYLLADSTAIYALGHLSITSESREHRLVAFWAPFLLLHLGGPHNITAYALEDNRLWLRHLQTLVVQALGAAYVLYKFYHAGSGSGGTLLLPASAVSMFVAGLAKYGERTWALRCANKSGRSSDGYSSTKSTEDNGVDPFRLLRRDMGDDEILVRAHTQFAICRSLFNDTKVDIRAKRSPGMSPFKDEDIFKLLEMELSLMYDTLYTKAPVIHTWYGICIHFISLVGTSAALCLFHLSRRGNHGARYNTPDVVISYVLLAGALVMEAISALRVVLSSRTCSFILCKAEDYPRACAWLRWLHASLRKPFKPASRRQWRGTMGQYNLLHLSTRDKADLGTKLAAKVGLDGWWSKLHFSGTFSGSDSLSMPRLKELVEKTVRQEGFANHVLPLNVSNWRGRFILTSKEAFKGVARWTVQNIEFDESIVIWHIATDILIWESTAAAGHNNYDIEIVEATSVLSNYMMFLLVAKPNMLPGRERHSVHLKASRAMKEVRQNHVLCDDDNPERASFGSWWKKCCVLKEVFHHEGPDCSSGISDVQKKKLIERLCCGWTPQLGEEMESDPQKLRFYLHSSLHTCALYLARELLQLGRPDTLELIFAVWVEMMLYAAENGPRDSHARELGNGGEFITIVWLLVQHYMYLNKYKIA